MTEQPEVPGSRVRPFLAQKMSALPPLTTTEGDFGRPGVRAYLLTGGRTDSGLDFETMLSVTAEGHYVRPTMAFERARIVDLCTETPQSVAELSARLHLPIGVVRVVGADMVDAGLLDCHSGRVGLSDDVDMLQRLIHGIRRL